MSSSVGTKDYGYETSTVYKRQQEEKESSGSGKTSHSDFLKLLTVQLTNQDPLNPMEDIDFTGQLAQLQALDEQMEMTKSMKAMRIDTQVQAGTNMIGKFVSGTDSNDIKATGLVTRVTQNDDGVFVELANGQKLAIGNINNVWNDANSMNNDISQSANLIGAWIEAGVDENKNPIRGIVESVSVGEDGALQIKLFGGQTVGWSDVTSMRAITEADALYYFPDDVRKQAEKARDMVNMGVTGTTDSGKEVSGVVAGADIVGSKIYLTLYNGETIELSKVSGEARKPTADDAQSLKGYYVAGLDKNSNDVEGLVIGAEESDEGVALILDDGTRIFFDSLTGIRDAEDEDKARLHGMYAVGTDTSGKEARGVITEKLEVDGKLAVKLDSGQVVLCENLKSVTKSEPAGDDAADASDKEAESEAAA